MALSTWLPLSLRCFNVPLHLLSALSAVVLPDPSQRSHACFLAAPIVAAVRVTVVKRLSMVGLCWVTAAQ